MNQYRSVVAALTLAAFSLAGAQTPPMPKGPVTINVIDVAGTRQFHRGAVFNGPYGKPIVPYDQSARVALKSVLEEPFVQSWRSTGQPDPKYPLYRYSSKIIGKLLTGCAMYARGWASIRRRKSARSSRVEAGPINMP